MNNSVERLWPAVESSRLSHNRHVSVSSKADRQKADLQAELDDVKQSLERANKRVNRLIGEKSQLSTLLDQRDDQIERLNRELGVRTPLQNTDETKDAKGSGALASVVETVLTAIKHTKAISIQWRGKQEDRATDRHGMAACSSGTHLVARNGGNAGNRIIGIVLFGLDEGEIERLLPIIEKDSSARGMKPLYLIDIDAFELLRSRGLIFEYLPSRNERERFDATLDWNLYLQRRLAIIRRKWDPARIVAFGQTAMNTMTLWSSSPFEEKPLPAVFSETAKTQGVEVAD